MLVTSWLCWDYCFPVFCPSLSSGNLWQDPVGSGTMISGFMDFISWHSGSLALDIALQSMLKDLSFKQRSPLWISVRSKSKFVRWCLPAVYVYTLLPISYMQHITTCTASTINVHQIQPNTPPYTAYLSKCCSAGNGWPGEAAPIGSAGGEAEATRTRGPAAGKDAAAAEGERSMCWKLGKTWWFSNHKIQQSFLQAISGTLCGGVSSSVPHKS